MSLGRLFYGVLGGRLSIFTVLGKQCPVIRSVWSASITVDVLATLVVWKRKTCAAYHDDYYSYPTNENLLNDNICVVLYNSFLWNNVICCSVYSWYETILFALVYSIPLHSHTYGVENMFANRYIYGMVNDIYYLVHWQYVTI